MNLTEKQIETYVQFPDELSKERRREVRRQIERDSEASLYFEWFKNYYAIYEELSKEEKRDAAVSIISMKPMIEDSESYRGIFILAAQSQSSKEHVIETLKTFASDEHNTLLRALYFKSRDEIKIHLLSNQIQKDDVLLFQIPASNLFFVSEPGGKVSVSVNELDPENVKEWDSFNVHIPVCTVSQNTQLSKKSYLAGRSAFTEDMIPIEIEKKENTVQLTPILNHNDPETNFLVLYRENQSMLFKMTDGVATVEQELLETEGVRLFFYN
ncbi:hypothetical protein CWD77_04695 [Rhodohalobacter barkolensis]|uniref:Uncharacterized protein n=2 Tax=Rhodohalobacter barkolensis TaxID=2053187 RepID=A0A2N0VKQ0_9BACT|nr:hypothetical protein CWD77_04695 [Rhodohalobacter barkolensis]